MEKQSSYQKLKAENEKLKQDIYQLIMNPEKLESLIIRERYKLKFEGIHLIMSGTFEKRNNCANGLINQMSKEEKNKLFQPLINSKTMIIPNPPSKKKPFFIGLFKNFK